MGKNEVYQQAIDLWGETAQMSLALEEMSELSQAILKFYRSPQEISSKTLIENIEQEIADVEIMMEQLRIVFDTKAISRIKARKIRRLQKRIAKEEK